MTDHGLVEARSGIMVKCCCGEVLFDHAGASAAEIVAVHAQGSKPLGPEADAREHQAALRRIRIFKER